MTTPSNQFQVLVLGSGDAFSSTRFYTSFLLFTGEQTILVDCPSPLRRVIREAAHASGKAIDVDDIPDVILTHLHGDHSNGLECMGFYRKFVAVGEERPRLYTSSEVLEDLWENKLRASMGRIDYTEKGAAQIFTLEDFFDVHPIVIGETFSIGAAEIQTRRTLHPLPCFALKVSYNGRCWAYSCDTSYDADLIHFLSDGDLVFHETGNGFHTPLEKLASLPSTVRDKLVVTHLPDEFEVSKSPIRVPHDGELFVL